MSVIFRGLPACECLAEWYPAYERELQRRDILSGAIRLYQLIGGNPKSGGTHLEGGAGDDDQVSEPAIWVARQMGADASWCRPFNWDGKGGIEHAHRVLRGCPHNEPARYQIDAVDAGFNGLGAGGRGAPDDGPRPLSGRTWKQGIEWQRQQEDWFEMATEAQLRAIVSEELAAFLANATVNNPSDPKGDPWKLTRLLIDTWKRAGKS